jgi:ATP-dependent DNA ligase
MNTDTTLNPETLVETLAPIYAKNINGQTKIWKCRVLTNQHGHGIYEIEHGQENGKLQLTRRVITEGKNLNKKNETSPVEQCTSELRKKWKDKQNKEGYSVAATAAAAENPDTDNTAAPTTRTVIYPMLAKNYIAATPASATKKSKNSIVFPCYVQPKLDGLRCLMYLDDSDVVTQSRTGGIFEHLGHITDILERDFFPHYPRFVLDGELYTTEIPFENLAGIIKKKNVNENDMRQIERVQYHIYDIINLDYPEQEYKNRDACMTGLEEDGMFHDVGGVIRFVDTYFVHTHDQFYDKFKGFILDGYEGAMLRNTEGVYRQNYRSADLQKYKEFQEDEYDIVGFTQGDGRDEGTVIWICITEQGRRFSVRPKGSVEYRRELYENAGRYVGKRLTVIFQELTEFGVPRFPVGKCVREMGI